VERKYPARQLEPWAMFREVYAEGAEDGYFANHCSHCGSVQEDLYLHSESQHRNLHL